MKAFFLSLCVLALASAAQAEDAPTLIATVTLHGTLKAGVATPITLTLTHADGAFVKPEELKEVHTQRVHLLVIDPTLADYQHIHPTPGRNGAWDFTFTPKREGAYRMWADVTPEATGRQEYLKVDMGMPSGVPPVIDKTITHTATAGGFTFTLTLDSPLKAGQAGMGSVKVTDKEGKPVARLAPVMGAFAHIVAFSEDYNTVLHVHPMGKEPASATERGGPELQFHIEPKQAGFIKLFVQTRINHKNISAPFGVVAE